LPLKSELENNEEIVRECSSGFEAMKVLSSKTNPLKSMFPKTIKPVRIRKTMAFLVVNGVSKFLKENPSSFDMVLW
jgi:hypothetical protein